MTGAGEQTEAMTAPPMGSATKAAKTPAVPVPPAAPTAVTGPKGLLRPVVAPMAPRPKGLSTPVGKAAAASPTAVAKRAWYHPTGAQVRRAGAMAGEGALKGGGAVLGAGLVAALPVHVIAVKRKATLKRIANPSGKPAALGTSAFGVEHRS